MTNKQFAEQAGLYYEFSITDEEYDLAIERFAEFVRDDERAKCVQDYLQDTCNAIDLVRIEEREACARTCDDMSEGLVGDDVSGATGAGYCANAIRARENHEQN